MKQFLYGALLAVVLVAATACSKDDDGPTGNNNNNNNNNNGSGMMKASISGTNWSAIVAEAYKDADSDELSLYGINVTDANAKDAKTIQITLDNYHGVGTYPLTTEENDAYTIEVVSSAPTVYGLDTDDEGKGGEVVITEATNKKVKGTFYFNATTVLGTKKHEIRSGTFELPIVAD